MSLGLALGGFADGFESGYGLGKKLRADRKEQRNQDAIDKINNDASAEFDKQVKAGTNDGKNFEGFWQQYALPKMRMELLRQGNYQQAAQLQKWGESESTLKGAKLFGSAMMKAQLGDSEGALDDGIKAAQTNGYLDHGYELKNKERIQDRDGNLLGFRVTFSDPSGKEMTQDIKAGDVPRVVATFANPQEAWKTQVEKNAKDTKRKEDLEDYTAKKKIDASYKDTAGEDYRKAFDSRMKSDLDFADKSSDEQDAVVRGDLERQKTYAAEQGAGANAPADGGNAAPAAAAKPPAPKREIVDQATGQVVSPDQASGITGQPAPAPAPAGAAPGLAPDVARPTAAAQTPDRAAAIDQASSAVLQGADPQIVAKKLQDVGISWPEFQQAFWQKQEAAGLTPAR